jgi:hypothetical protein
MLKGHENKITQTHMERITFESQRLCFSEQLVSGSSLEQLRAADVLLLRSSKALVENRAGICSPMLLLLMMMTMK